MNQATVKHASMGSASVPSITKSNVQQAKVVPLKSRKMVSPLTLSIFFGVLFLLFASPWYLNLLIN